MGLTRKFAIVANICLQPLNSSHKPEVNVEWVSLRLCDSAPKQLVAHRRPWAFGGPHRLHEERQKLIKLPTRMAADSWSFIRGTERARFVLWKGTRAKNSIETLHFLRHNDILLILLLIFTSFIEGIHWHFRILYTSIAHTIVLRDSVPTSGVFSVLCNWGRQHTCMP